MAYEAQHVPEQTATGSLPQFEVRHAVRDSAAAQGIPRWKRTMDVLGALALGVVFFPIIAVVILFLARTGGPVIFKQRRVGQGGKEFWCYKFRTMVPGADKLLQEVLDRDHDLRAEWDASQKLRQDPRVTPVGRFLRRTSLDELPQIINILRGEMSLVGPRPALPEQMHSYGRAKRWYSSVRPGITGLWQVKARGCSSFRRRVALDAYYCRNVNIALDVAITLKTVHVLLTGRGAH